MTNSNRIIPVNIGKKKKKKVVKTKKYIMSGANRVDDFYPVIEDNVFASWIKSIVSDRDNETNGFFHYDEEKQRIVWWGKAEEVKHATGASVASFGGKAIADALATIGQLPNGQWHTQPGMGVHYSSTDLRDQEESIKTAMKLRKDGRMYFIVIDEMTWRADFYEWKEGEVTDHHSGMVQFEDGTDLDFRFTTSYVVGGSNWVQDKYGGYYQSYFDNWRSKYDKKESKESPAEEVVYGAKPDDSPLDIDSLFSEYEMYEDGIFYPSKAECDLYMGVQSKDHRYYNQLFEIFGVGKYDWQGLYYTIEAWYGEDSYTKIVNQRGEYNDWNKLQKEHSELLREFEVDYQHFKENHT